MEQINNHYHGPVTVQGSNIQSHYVPAEKPYAVYAFVWEGPFTSVAQLIGTMLVGRPDEEGNMVFRGKAVYRLPERDTMLDTNHCFIPDDMGGLVSDEIFLGYQGDRVGLKEVAKVVYLDNNLADGSMLPGKFVECMRLAGLEVDLPESTNIHRLEATFFFENRGDSYEKSDWLLSVRDDAPVNVRVWSHEGRSEPSYRAASRLWSQISGWKDIGVTFEGFRLEGRDGKYQPQVDELLELARIFGKYNDDSFRMYYLLACRMAIGTGRCLYDDFVRGMYNALYEGYQYVDRDLEAAIASGLVTREGNILQFSEEVERFAAWEFSILDGR